MRTRFRAMILINYKQRDTEIPEVLGTRCSEGALPRLVWPGPSSGEHVWMRGAQLWRWGQLKCGHSPWTDPLFCFVFLALPFLLYVYCGKRGSWPKVVVAIVRSLSHVQLFAAPWTIAHQPPLSMGFLRQEYWSGLPFPSLGDLPDPEIEPFSPTVAVPPI